MFFADRPGDHDLEAPALAALRSARELRGLSPVQVQRIEERLKRRVLRKRPALRLAMAAGLVLALCAGGTFAVARIGLRRLPLLGPLFAPREAPFAAKTGPAEAPDRARVPAVDEPVPLAPSVPRATGPAGTSDRPPRPIDPRRKTPPRLSNDTPPAEAAPANGPAPPIPAILIESQSLSAAVGKWHRDHDARAALDLLDGHERRFPGGQLEVEAAMLRAEILLREGQEREALRLLDSVSLAGLPRARELQTVRGELRLKYGRCPEGRRDLEAVRAEDAVDDLGRRATRALRACP